MKWCFGVISKKQVDLHTWLQLGAHTQQEERFKMHTANKQITSFYSY